MPFLEPWNRIKDHIGSPISHAQIEMDPLTGKMHYGQWFKRGYLRFENWRVGQYSAWWMPIGLGRLNQLAIDWRSALIKRDFSSPYEKSCAWNEYKIRAMWNNPDARGHYVCDSIEGEEINFRAYYDELAESGLQLGFALTAAMRTNLDGENTWVQWFDYGLLKKNRDGKPEFVNLGEEMRREIGYSIP